MKKQEEHCMDNESQGQKKNERQNYSTLHVVQFITNTKHKLHNNIHLQK